MPVSRRGKNVGRVRKEEMNILGIDPGKNGGIALIGDFELSPLFYKMPETIKDVWDLISGLPIHFAYIEKVNASPQMGVVSAFTFGRGYGFLLMGLHAAKIPFEEVRPYKWQKYMGCLSKGDKNITKDKAQQLFPMVKVTHAIADALLIAEYGRRIRS